MFGYQMMELCIFLSISGQNVAVILQSVAKAAHILSNALEKSSIPRHNSLFQQFAVLCRMNYGRNKN